jgi:hypothetical protein
MYGIVPSSPTDGDSGNLDKARARFTETVDLPTPPIKMFLTLILCDTELILTSKVSHPYPDLNGSQIRMRLKSWIRIRIQIRIKLKIPELSRLKTEPLRAVDAQNRGVKAQNGGLEGM